jgi:hypothetical protein
MKLLETTYKIFVYGICAVLQWYPTFAKCIWSENHFCLFCFGNLFLFFILFQKLLMSSMSFILLSCTLTPGISVHSPMLVS